MASTSVQERIKRLNQQESGPKAGHVPHGSVHGRVQMLNMTTNKSSTMTKDKAQLFKAAKLIKKTFSNDSADGDAPFLSSHSKQQKRHTEDNVPPSDNTSSQVSLSDEEEDGELDAAAAMAYWRNRGSKGNAVRKETREHPSTKQTHSIRGVRTSAPAPKLPAEEQAGNSSSLEENNCPAPSIPQQQQQGQQSTVKDRVIFRTPDEDEEAPFDVTAADASSSTNNNARYAMPVSSVKSSESVFSGDSIFSGTSSSRASTLSARAKKFVEKKRRNVAIVTGQGGVDNNADESGADTGKSTAKSILREKACRDRLKKKASAPLATPAPIAVGETVELCEDNTSKTDDIIQIKADMPFDEPNKKNTSGDSFGVITVEANGDEVKPESIVSSNKRNFAFASMDKVKANQWDNTSQHTESTNNSSNHSAVIRVTQQDKNNNSEGSLSTEFTNQSEMPITTRNITGSVTSNVSQLTSKESLPSDRSSRCEEQKRKPRPVTEKADKGILNTFGALVEDAGCQFLDSLESSSSCIANALKGINEDANVPFDEEDVAIEVEYVDQANV